MTFFFQITSRIYFLKRKRKRERERVGKVFQSQKSSKKKKKKIQDFIHHILFYY